MAFRLKPSGRALKIQASQLAPALEADDKFKDKVGQRLRRSYRASAHNAFSEIDRILNEGIPNSGMAGARRIDAKDASGKTVRITTEHWKALDPKYRKYKPDATRNLFWTNRPELAKLYRVEIGRVPPIEVRQVPMGRSHHRGTVRLGYNVGLKGPYARAAWKFIAVPFVSGEPGYSGGSGAANLKYSRHSSELLGYPESGPYRRPFLRQLAAALGKRARTALRTLE